MLLLFNRKKRVRADLFQWKGGAVLKVPGFVEEFEEEEEEEEMAKFFTKGRPKSGARCRIHMGGCVCRVISPLTPPSEKKADVTNPNLPFTS